MLAVGGEHNNCWYKGWCELGHRNNFDAAELMEDAGPVTGHEVGERA